MARLTRRGFLQTTTVGAAALGAAAAIPGVASVPDAWGAGESALTSEELSGLIVAHVRNLSTGEIALMIGTREIVFRDRKLVARLVKAGR